MNVGSNKCVNILVDEDFSTYILMLDIRIQTVQLSNNHNHTKDHHNKHYHILYMSLKLLRQQIYNNKKAIFKCYDTKIIV